jgi:Ca2+-dependent lipid-binding protein
MFDKDVAKDDPMGILNIQLKEVPPGQIVRSWYSFDPVGGRRGPGEIDLTIQVARSGSAQWQPSRFAAQAVVVHILEAAKLPALDTGSQSDPFAVVNLKGSPPKYKTKVKDNTAAPVWNETVEFLITAIATDVLEVVVIDKDVAKDDLIGSVAPSLVRFVNGSQSDAWYPLAPPKRAKPAGEIRLQIQIVAPPIKYATEEPGKTSSRATGKG